MHPLWHQPVQSGKASRVKSCAHHLVSFCSVLSVLTWTTRWLCVTLLLEGGRTGKKLGKFHNIRWMFRSVENDDDCTTLADASQHLRVTFFFSFLFKTLLALPPSSSRSISYLNFFSIDGNFHMDVTSSSSVRRVTCLLREKSIMRVMKSSIKKFVYNCFKGSLSRRERNGSGENETS